jgi:hypothetical protein
VIVRISAILSTLIGTGLIGMAFINTNILWPVFLLVGFLILWFLALFLQWEWINTPGLLLIFGIIALGFIINSSPTLLFAGAFLYLGGWDLTEFYYRLQMACKEGNLHDLVKYHFLYLGVVLVVSLVILLFAVNLKFKIPFGWVTILSFTAAFGLGKFISTLLTNK